MLKKVFIIVSLLYFITNVRANMELRNSYQIAIYNRQIAEELIKNLSQKSNLTSLELGYLGATKMVMAKHYFNPFNKLRSFNEGRLQLDEAIIKDGQNPELIFLRYACAKHTPSFLNYQHHLAADKKFLEGSLKNINDKDLKNRISDFLNKEK